ncbi:hypothetical protein M2322_000825 [Rhodoblastus acidophilus]|nr:hypothetical protein [Rhodoblastus acidophilus]
MAIFLSTNQTKVFRLEAPGGEGGPFVLLLNVLQEGVATGVVTSGMTPEDALARLGLAAPASEAAPRNLVQRSLR